MVFDFSCILTLYPPDPEHPYTLEQLNVVQEDLIKVSYDTRHTCTIRIEFTPTGILSFFVI